MTTNINRTPAEQDAAIVRFGFDQPEITVQMMDFTQPINKADWFCQYCPEPLGKHAVTTFGGYAHRTCEPLFQIIDRDIQAAYERLNSEAAAPESSIAQSPTDVPKESQK